MGRAAGPGRNASVIFPRWARVVVDKLSSVTWRYWRLPNVVHLDRRPSLWDVGCILWISAMAG